MNTIQKCPKKTYKTERTNIFKTKKVIFEGKKKIQYTYRSPQRNKQSNGREQINLLFKNIFLN